MRLPLTVGLLLALSLAMASAQETYESNRIYCYLSQGTDQFMQYTVNSEKYQCMKYRFKCNSSMNGSCTEQQIARGRWRNFYSITTPDECKAKQAEAAANPHHIKAVVCCSTSDCTRPNYKTEPYLRLSFHFGELN